MRVLVAEDDPFLAKAITLALEVQKYDVDLAKDGLEADLTMRLNNHDLLILDLNLPKLDGLQVLRNLRARGQTIPVLILSVRGTINDKVLGLDAGANDYLTKPFDLAEFEARIRALLRKERWQNKAIIDAGSLRYDTVKKDVTVNGKILELSPRELAILEVILQNLGRIVTKERLSDCLSGRDMFLSNNAIQIIIHRLRKKLSSANLGVRTVRGVGYSCEIIR